ncbi:MAG: sigma-70 family RNA polymerase sigma factor, partial [Roseibium sp.]
MTDPFCGLLIEKLPNLRRYALSLCRSGDQADDLVQTTVERALKARASFDPASRIEAWLFRILRNAWIDIVRKNRVRGQELD